ncbi:MAG: TIR domain-containing protein [Thermodesulfobacteriota bacterium]
MKASTGKPTVFISYSHKDEVWKDRLRPHLKALEKVADAIVWDDRQIPAGEDWYDRIKETMERATAAVCLVSADYLASDFCEKEEIPYLLERRAADGILLIPVLIQPCPWKLFTWVKEIQMLPRDGKSVAELSAANRNKAFAEVTLRIHEFLTNPKYVIPTPPPPWWNMPDKVDISRLPVTGKELFGRKTEIALLNETWDEHKAHVLSFVAWGGVGKSTLVNKWIEQLREDNYRGAERVYAWSFYSQGTGERVTSADLFVDQALRWFDDLHPATGSPWDKGERLAGLVRRQKTLLLLDGLEPLQAYQAEEKGRIKDAALATLVAELARDNPGLCVITTREHVTDLDRFSHTVRQQSLETITPEAGRSLLRVHGVIGTDAELEQVTRDFGCHALALNLLGSYLHEMPGHPVARAREIPDLDIPEKKGRHPRRIMAVRAKQLKGTPELDLLHVLGLFDRPADTRAVAAVTAAPAIKGLTDHLQNLSEAAWNKALKRLREMGLLASESRHHPDALDAHPLVREHFGEQLEKAKPKAINEGHRRLYEFLKGTAKELPDTIDEMTPLFAVVYHGCKARLYQEALVEVYSPRILRQKAHDGIHNLGAFGANLACLAGFFAVPWTRPADGLTEEAKPYLLSVVGFCLKAQGRLVEAGEPMQASMRADIAQEDWRNAAVDANNLSELHLSRGKIGLAVEYAQKAVGLADRSRDGFMRMFSRTTLADAIHQAGGTIESQTEFARVSFSTSPWTTCLWAGLSLAWRRQEETAIWPKPRLSFMQPWRVCDKPVDRTISPAASLLGHTFG